MTNDATVKRPTGGKSYGSIPHLPGSRLGPGDHHCHEGQARICTEKLRDKYDRVIVQEKLDGCLKKQTPITLPDGTTKHIGSIQTGEYVLGLDTNGQPIPSRVINIFNNGSAAVWLKVTTTRIMAGRGKGFCSVTCTPNHKFYDPQTGTYVSAINLVPGRKVLVHRFGLDLTPIQRSILLGKLLGDGYLQKAMSGASSVSWGHREQDAEYVAWVARGLGTLAISAGEMTSGYGTKIVRGRTVFSSFITKYFGDFYSSTRKIVPSWVADELSPLAIAFWYMDDGSLSDNSGQENRAYFSVCGFDEEDCVVLSRGLGKYGITPITYGSKGYLYLRLNSDDSERLFLLIAPYVPPAMQRKLPTRYRDHPGWLPATDKSSYKPLLTEQTVISVDINESASSCRYDLETETHNFFAGGILVHNSNVGVARINGEIIPLTRSGYLANTSKYEQHHLFWDWALEHREMFLELLEDGERVCGEWLAQAHAIRYKINCLFEPFQAFDIMRGNVRVDWDTFVERLCFMRKPFCSVKLICLGPIKPEAALAKDCMVWRCDPAEGVIYRVERYDYKTSCWRVDFLAKYVRPDKVDGCYLPEVSGLPAIWNWRPEGVSNESETPSSGYQGSQESCRP